ncbi:hypothetical protein LIER_23326 [Lithospermum erythrorhizon]|uniref:Uncharacterized protein n=1 Tax=Lithospermum erythrorhizon TaxID=34254 RepID=A0AAV3R054_LITER
MMEINRRSYGQEGSLRRSYNRKPPRGSWKPTVPAWEKTFCKAVGCLDWEAFLDMKKFVYLYENILKWNDSAAEEAFYSAKKRFWEELNGIPCDVEVPDPDLYIDEVDWDCQVDEELLSDHDYRSVAGSDDKSDAVIIFGDSLIPSLPFFGTGWGTGWGDEEDIPKGHGNQRECGFENTTGRENENGTGDCANNTWHLDKGDGWRSDLGKSQNMNRGVNLNISKNRNSGSARFWREWDSVEAARTRDGMSRFKVSRYHGEEHNINSSRRNWKGRNRENFVSEQYNIGRRPPTGGWNLNACRPNSHQTSDSVRQTWNLKKPVS